MGQISLILLHSQSPNNQPTDNIMILTFVYVNSISILLALHAIWYLGTHVLE